jgi:glutathione S-transferase
VALNPLGKIPTLERAGGPALYDSRVICRYLDDLAGGRLYPEKPRLWETLTLEATAHGVAEAAVLMVYEERLRPEEARSEAWVEGQWAKVARALDALEARWMSHLAGPLDMGQIATGCALGYLDFRHGRRDWRAGRPALAAWEAKFAARPAMARRGRGEGGKGFGGPHGRGAILPAFASNWGMHGACTTYARCICIAKRSGLARTGAVDRSVPEAIGGRRGRRHGAGASSTPGRRGAAREAPNGRR